jgi:hypothetical protein
MSDVEHEIVVELEAYRRVIATLLRGPYADTVRDALRAEGLRAEGLSET